MRVVATIEARMGSSRLPGKVLAEVAGRPVLEHIIERLRATEGLDDVVVATTEKPGDLPIVDLAGRVGCKCFRGSEDDVLGRVVGAAESAATDVIVEITGDCPFVDPGVVAEHLSLYAEGGSDVVCNMRERTYPMGLDTQVFGAARLARVARETRLPAHREHVSKFFYDNAERFVITNLLAPREWYDPYLRLLLDVSEDLELVRAIYGALYRPGRVFPLEDVMDLVRGRPEIRQINAHLGGAKTRLSVFPLSGYDDAALKSQTMPGGNRLGTLHG